MLHMVIVVSEIKTLAYGSVSWANWILKDGIHECNNVGRDHGARLQTIAYYLRILKESGFSWQYARLENHVNLAFKRGRLQVSKRPDSSSKDEETSC